MTIILSAYLILLRYITATYIYGIFFALLGYLLLTLFFENKHARPTIEAKQRIKYLSLSILAISLLIAPFLWSGWEAFYHYYVDNHVLSKEKYIRASQVGVHDFMTALVYYPKSILAHHLGSLCLSLIGIAGLGSFILFKLEHKRFAKSSLSLILCFLLLSIMVPIAILSLDYSKSPVVGNVTVVSILWLIVWSVFAMYQRCHSKLFTWFILAISTAAFISGAWHYGKTTGHHYSALQRKNLNQITQMYMDIGTYLYSNNKFNAILSTDRIADYLVPQHITILFYEKNKILLRPASSKLGSTLYEINKDDAIASVRGSDVFIVNQSSYPHIRDDYPFNNSLNLIRPDLRTIAKREFIRLGDYSINGYPFGVYIKKDS